MLFHTNFSAHQRELLKSIFPPLSSRLRRHDPFDILDAIFLIVKTGIQWCRLPTGYPTYQTVYYHYRCWCECGHLDSALHALVVVKRQADGQHPEPAVGVVDSQSVRTGLPHSELGIDGGKRIKGIKRHLMVDDNGLPMGVHVTKANIHDNRGAEPLIANILSLFRETDMVKGALGYRGAFKNMPFCELGLMLDCVKSNFGTSQFIPIDGR